MLNIVAGAKLGDGFLITWLTNPPTNKINATGKIKASKCT
jgi:hypothetical protein